LHGGREVKQLTHIQYIGVSFKGSQEHPEHGKENKKEENNNYDVKEYSSSNPSGSGFRYIFSH
ncbi:MAG: hypothetical protein ACLTXL_15500, partial [Clostridia bacterium]